MKSYLSVKQVVERLNNAISAKLVYRLIDKGKLRANRETGKILVEEDSLLELMEGKPKPSETAPQPSPPPALPRPRRRKGKQKLELW